jgi:hypothetical protein
MSKYWLVNKSQFDTNWIKKIIDFCNPHLINFNVFVYKDYQDLRKIYKGMSGCSYPDNPANHIGGYLFFLRKRTDRFLPKPCIIIYTGEKIKFPIKTYRDSLYRKVMEYKNIEDFLIKALAHEIKHIKNAYIPLKNLSLQRGMYALNNDNSARIKLSVRAEWESRTAEENIGSKLKRAGIL